jgi:hypothetical protein
MADLSSRLADLVADLHDQPRRHWADTVAACSERVTEES